jgi:hypothetical protein
VKISSLSCPFTLITESNKKIVEMFYLLRATSKIRSNFDSIYTVNLILMSIREVPCATRVLKHFDYVKLCRVVIV